MTTSETTGGSGRNWNLVDLLAGLILVAGIGLSGAGSYLHLTIAAQVSAGRCDGCEPWHPLLIVAPIVVGAALVLVGGYLLYRRRLSSR